MALGRLFPRPPGFGSPPEAEPIPDGLLDCWDDAPDVDVQGIWDRVTAELGDQDAPPAGPRLRILLFPRTRIQLAGAAASLVVAALISGSVLLSGAEGEATGIRTDIAHLAIATRVALDDGEITAAELTALEDVGVLIHHYLTDPDMLAGVTDAELDQLIGTLAATRATLLEHRGDLADAAAARLETLSALAIRTRLARGTVGTLVVARPVDPSLVQSDEILAADELPVTVTAGDVGSLQILGDVVGLEVGGVSSVTGWTPTVERGFGRDIGVVFERNGATVEVTAQIVEDFIVLWVVGQALSDLAAADAGTGTAAGDATLALQDPVHTFAVRLAGFVVLGQDGEALEVLQVEAESGLRVLVGSDEEPLQIDFVGPASVVRFRAHRDDGVIRTSVQEIPLPVVTPDLRGMLDLTSAEPRAADDVATPGREDDG
ncbi:MAG TPA: hypothetical protein QGF05_04055, partial [Dehalococcoidia bacterium]|nr:hypothetical protein [Dehalococcoidia bacterium]